MNSVAGLVKAVPIEIKLNEIVSNVDVVPVDIQVLKVGIFYDPRYGKVEITQATLLKLKENFDNNVRRIDVAIDYNHNSEDIAAGWVRQLSFREKGTELWAQVQWTPNGKRALADKEFRYISADFDFNYQDNESLQIFGPVLLGAALTNRPVIKAMAPAVELQEEETLSQQQYKDPSKRDQLKSDLEARSKQYGIEVTKDAALTPPAGDPTSPDGYGDPVNYKFPLGSDDQIRNARVRFKQFADQTYQNDSSKAVVHERIVRKELSTGIGVSFDPKDHLDALLPSDLKDKLKKPQEEGKKKMADQPMAPAPVAPEAQEPEMTVEQMKAFIADLKAKVDALEGEKAAMMAQKKMSEKKAQFDKFLTEGKVCEAQRESFISGDTVKFAETAQPVTLKPTGTTEVPPVTDAPATPDEAVEQVTKLAEEKVSEAKKAGKRIELADAISSVLRENKELAKKIAG